jgi:hypothetical protein
MSADNPATEGTFAYRQCSDGSITAICLHCYGHAASAHTFSHLTVLEAQHRCKDKTGAKPLFPTGKKGPESLLSQG